MKIIYRAYLLLLVVLLATTFFFKGIVFDIHIHDTKLVIAHLYIGLWLSFYVLILTIANYWMSKYRNKVSLLQWIVFITTVLVFFWILFAPFFQSKRPPAGPIDLTAWQSFGQFQKVNEITSILTFLFVLTHLSFWIYFLVFLIRKFILKKPDLAHITSS
jgi:heme/copper-type cytochrome/quinol oxidase subunit 1